MQVIETAPADLHAESSWELADDFEELAFVARAMEQRLHGWGEMRRWFERRGHELHDLRAAAAEAPDQLPHLTRMHETYARLLRARLGIAAAMIAADDWQSPSFGHSLRDQAGRQAGCIRPHVNDYKRDRHLDAGRYESAYLREYVDAPPGEPIRALLTSCGMAGLTTILGYLRLEGHLIRPVVAGRALYHETALLLARELGDRLVVVDERDPAEVIETVRRTGAGALFLDSLCNSRGLALPDTARIIRGLAGDDVHVVIDNTGLSIGFQPWALRSGRTRLLVWESLLKYAQLGLDRTTAGVVVCSGPGTERLDIYREHLGTNIADISVLALPPPHRSILDRRLARLERNARLIADALGQWAVYPGRGGCLELAVRDRAGFAERALAAARAAGVPLVAGTSFGFHITRIYAAAEGSACGPAFLRVSAGSEHRLGAEAVASALARTLEVLA